MSDKYKLITELKNYKPFDDEEKLMLEKFIFLVETNKDCFQSYCYPEHITACAWIIDKNYSHLLFTHHKKLDKWLQLGGHADGEENLLNVATREAKEESGLTSIEVITRDIFSIDIHPIPARNDVQSHYHYDVRYFFKADKNEKLVVSSESKDLKWLPISQIELYNNDRAVLRMLKKTKDFIKYIDNAI